MARQGISTGSIPNDGTGDTLLAAAVKINTNFSEIYNAIGNGTDITNTINNLSTLGISTISGVTINSGIVTAASFTGSDAVISGNVGIGTTNPTSKLTVQGGDIAVGIGTDNGLILTSPNGNRYRLYVEDNGTLTTILV